MASPDKVLQAILSSSFVFRVLLVLLTLWSSSSEASTSISAKNIDQVTSTDTTSRCPSDINESSQRLWAEYHENRGTGQVRVKICSCHWPASLSYVVTDQSCQSPPLNNYLQVDHTAVDPYLQCVWTKPVDLNVSGSFNLTGSSLMLCPLINNLSANPNNIPLLHHHPKRSSRSFGNPSTSSGEAELAHDRNSEARVLPEANVKSAVVTGLRVEEAEKGIFYDDGGAVVVLAGALISIRLFGYDLSDSSEFRFVFGALQRGEECDSLPFTVSAQAEKDTLTAYSTLVHIRLPHADQVSGSLTMEDDPTYYVCSLERRNGHNRWIHQGKEPGLMLKTFQKTLPLWFQVVIIAMLLSLSGLFSGLNLGLMALDRTELKLYETTGTEKEKRYASMIIPVRNHGNYLLCTLLLSNVLVNSTLTILLDDLTSGVIAIVGSTMGIVILGEIVPQAICSRYGLAIGARTIWITKFFMFITFPVSYPISLILDRILGEEIGAYYNRERLKELLRVTDDYHDLEKDEVDIIAGALELRRKTVTDVMTHLNDVFMLPFDSVLDFTTVSEIIKQGFSRVPVYDGERSNIVGLLFTKELAFLDPEEAIPLKTVCHFNQNTLNFVLEGTTLDVIFNDFKEGTKGHMAFIHRLAGETDGEPFHETIGLVTLEDVIEELIQAEIVDETDVWVDNRSKRRREKGKLLQDLSSFADRYNEQNSTKRISPQLALATFRFLSSSVDPFKPERISENVLHRLMRQSFVIRFISVKDPSASKTDPNTYIYKQGRPADYFVLILEGHVEVEVGKENLVYESGPFSHFGSQFLADLGVLSQVDSNASMDSRSTFQLFHGSVQSIKTKRTLSIGPEESGSRGCQSNFIPDYTARAITDVVYFRISHSLYHAARKATFLERAQQHGSSNLKQLQRSLLQSQNVMSSSKADMIGKVTNGGATAITGGSTFSSKQSLNDTNASVRPSERLFNRRSSFSPAPRLKKSFMSHPYAVRRSSHQHNVCIEDESTTKLVDGNNRPTDARKLSIRSEVSLSVMADDNNIDDIIPAANACQADDSIDKKPYSMRPSDSKFLMLPDKVDEENSNSERSPCHGSVNSL